MDTSTDMVGEVEYLDQHGMGYVDDDGIFYVRNETDELNIKEFYPWFYMHSGSYMSEVVGAGIYQHMNRNIGRYVSTSFGSGATRTSNFHKKNQKPVQFQNKYAEFAYRKVLNQLWTIADGEIVQHKDKFYRAAKSYKGYIMLTPRKLSEALVKNPVDPSELMPLAYETICNLLTDPDYQPFHVNLAMMKSFYDLGRDTTQTRNFDPQWYKFPDLIVRATMSELEFTGEKLLETLERKLMTLRSEIRMQMREKAEALQARKRKISEAAAKRKLEAQQNVAVRVLPLSWIALMYQSLALETSPEALEIASYALNAQPYVFKENEPVFVLEESRVLSCLTLLGQRVNGSEISTSDVKTIKKLCKELKEILSMFNQAN